MAARKPKARAGLGVPAVNVQALRLP